MSDAHAKYERITKRGLINQIILPFVVMMISSAEGAKTLCTNSDSYEEEEEEHEDENFQGSDEEYVLKTYEDFQNVFKGSHVEKVASEPQCFDSETEDRIALELQKATSSNSDLEMEEESLDEEISHEELSCEGRSKTLFKGFRRKISYSPRFVRRCRLRRGPF